MSRLDWMGRRRPRQLLTARQEVIAMLILCASGVAAVYLLDLLLDR